MGAGGFVHGFTYSHAPGGAAVAREVLRILDDGGPRRGQRGSRASASRTCSTSGSRRIPTSARSAAAGLMVGLGARRRPRDAGAVPAGGAPDGAVVRAARDAGVLVYSGTGNANGVDGDTILLGPPFVVTDDELVRIADRPWRARRRRDGEPRSRPA